MEPLAVGLILAFVAASVSWVAYVSKVLLEHAKIIAVLQERTHYDRENIIRLAGRQH